MPSSRQLAAIMFTDIVGYTALMQQNEQQALSVIKHYNSTLEYWVTHHNGQVSNYYGDGSLCIFPSATDAINCAIAVQKELKTAPVVPLRIGLHIGEVFFEEGKALGDGVNVASRVQSLGLENTILISEEVHDKIKNNTSITSISLGRFDFKNVHKPMEVYALTNEGLTVPNPKKLEGKLKKGKKALNRKMLLAMSMILLAVSAFFIYKQVLANKDPIAEKSIAILPFVDMSAARDQEYFSDGLSEELLNLLAKIPELKVIGRTSSFSFKGKNEHIQQIAEQLGVAHILEGSVRKDGNHIRISAKLIKAKDGTQLWSDTYERDLKGIFKLQDEIARAVVQELKLKLLELPSATISGNGNIEAYNLLLQGNYFYDKLDRENVARAVECYRQALVIDSTDARAWAKLANALSRQAWQNYIDRQEGREKAAQAALKAITLNKNLAEGYIELGDLKLYQDLNWKAAEADYQKALALEPENAEVLYSLGGGLYFAIGRWNDAIRLSKKCITIDPLKPLYYMNLGNILTHAGRVQEATGYFKKALDLNPQFQRAHLYLGRNYLLLGKPEMAMQEMKQENLEVFRTFGMALSHFAAGNQPEADRTLQDFTSKFQLEWPYLLAELHAFRGEKDKAFSLLEEAYQKKDGWLVFLKGDPLLKKLKTDTRYGNFLKKLNLPPD